MDLKLRVDCSYLPTSALRRTQIDGCFVYDHVTSSQPCPLIMGESFRPGSERFSLALPLRQARPRQYGDFLPSHLFLIRSPDLLAWIWWGQRPCINLCSNFVLAEILSIRREVGALLRARPGLPKYWFDPGAREWEGRMKKKWSRRGEHKKAYWSNIANPV